MLFNIMVLLYFYLACSTGCSLNDHISSDYSIIQNTFKIHIMYKDVCIMFCLFRYLHLILDLSFTTDDIAVQFSCLVERIKTGSEGVAKGVDLFINVRFFSFLSSNDICTEPRT